MMNESKVVKGFGEFLAYAISFISDDLRMPDIMVTWTSTSITRITMEYTIMDITNAAKQ